MEVAEVGIADSETVAKYEAVIGVEEQMGQGVRVEVVLTDSLPPKPNGKYRPFHAYHADQSQSATG